MPSRSKRKGTGFERELVQEAQAAGLDAFRCWGSDGRSRGYHKDVDLVVAGSVTVQAKRRAKLPAWLKPSDSVNATIVREDRGSAYVILPYEQWLLLLKRGFIMRSKGSALHESQRDES